MRTPSLATGCLLLLAPVLPAQDATATRARAEFDSLLAANRMSVRLDQGSLAGDGAAWLTREAAAAQYFMLGEQHLTREITHFEAAILRGLPAAGYTHLAIEVGPYSTPFAERHIRARTLEAYLARPDRTLTLPFLFQREFAEMVASFVRAVPGAGPVLLGLDQEFVAAGPIIADLLAAEARTPAERAAVAEFARALEGNRFLVGQSDGAALRALRDAFAASGSVTTRTLTEELLLSNEIYAPFTGRGGSVRAANDRREAYIKRNFVTQYERAGGRGKVAAVFGANHAIRGFSPTLILGFGNFLQEYATLRNERFLNVHLDCLGGTMRNPQTGEAVPCPSYYLGVGGALREGVAGEHPVLVDLRPLRARLDRWPFLSEREKMLILGFDAYLAVPNVTPATLIGAPPGR